MQKFADGRSPHLRTETFRILLFRVNLLLVRKKLPHLERRVARLDDNPVLIVDDALQLAHGLVQQKPHAGRRTLIEPNVADRNRQLDMPHALPADGRQGDFNAATVANHAFVLDALVLAAGALPILRRPEDLLAEKTVALRTVRAVVDRLRIAHLAVRPLADGLGRSQLNLNGIIVGGRAIIAAKDVCHVEIVHFIKISQKLSLSA